jgi:hypothetical protein
MWARLLAIALALVVTQQAPASSPDDWDWLNESRQPAFDRLFPVSTNPELLLAYRSYRDLYQDVPERYLRIERSSDPGGTGDAFVATVVVPVGRSVQQQLLDLHRSRPKDSLGTLLAQVRVQRATAHSRACGGLKASLDALSTQSIAIPKRNLIVLHPNLHRFVIDLATAQMDVTLTDDRAPLVRWAITTIAAVRRCSG